ncbi:MAG: hypothetical protein KDA80_14150 [Planctomycetaceae bacterium]|nr:hypothetical protein [Planctomycetaceae bacterium]
MRRLIPVSTVFALLFCLLAPTPAPAQDLKSVVESLGGQLKAYLQTVNQSSICLAEFRGTDEDSADQLKAAVKEALDKLEIAIVAEGNSAFRLCGNMDQADTRDFRMISVEFCVQDSRRVDATSLRERFRVPLPDKNDVE